MYSCRAYTEPSATPASPASRGAAIGDAGRRRERAAARAGMTPKERRYLFTSNSEYVVGTS
eukprot:scaffold178095_cov35-Tisochrysis_lutea.AAC.1